MLKILLADDDQVAIQGVRLLLNKRNYNFEIYEAENGQSALQILQETHIDILFTDVDMPLINGIELTRRAQQLYPSIRVIFFSGYSDFSYAKSAIQLNAVSYLLKPIQPAEFYDVIDHIISMIPQTIGVDNTTPEPAETEDISVKHNLELYFSDLFFHCEMELDAAIPVLPILKGDDNSSLHMVFLRSNLSLHSSQWAHIDELLKKISKVPAELYVISGSYALITLDLSRGRKLLLDWDTWWQACKQAISPPDSDNVFLAIRTIPITNMQDLISEMRAIRRLLLLNHYIRETTLIRTEFVNDDEAASFQIDHIVEDMQKIVSCKAFYQLPDKLHTLMSGLLYNHSYSTFYVKHLLLNIVSEIEKQVPKDFSATIENAKSLLAMSPSLIQSEEILQDMLQKLEDFQNQKFPTTNRYVSQIQTIILTNYASDIGLNYIAEHVNLSVTYMCNLFKNELGISIGQYIKNVRMEKAKELLSNTNLRLNDIYPQVGYSSLAYFCVAFKETFGITPTQFRQQEVK